MFIPGLLWLAYGAWEYSLKGSGANIRVDLLLIYPLLLLAMIIGAVMTVFFTMKKPSGFVEEVADQGKTEPDSEKDNAAPAG